MPGDKELIGLYKSTGTGTGIGINIGTGDGTVGVPVDEQEVVESKQALRSLALGAGLTVVVALGQFVEAVAPQLTAVVMSYLPHIPFLSAQVVAGVLLGGAAWIQKRAAAKHKVAVVKALVTEPSTSLREAYVDSKRGE